MYNLGDVQPSTQAALTKLYPGGDYAAAGYSAATAVSRLQNAGYINEALDLAIATNQSPKMIAAVAAAQGAKTEQTLWNQPVTSIVGSTTERIMGGLPSLDTLVKAIPWVVGGVIALMVLPPIIRAVGPRR